MSHSLVRRLLFLSIALLASAFLSPRLAAQDKDKDGLDEEDIQILKKLAPLSKPGPFKAKMMAVAEIDVPEGFRFIPRERIQEFNAALNELTGDGECGAIYPAKPKGTFYYILFSYNDIGYVKDDEKDKLDANELLKIQRESMSQANIEFRKRGWPARSIRGWEKTPFYDPQTNYLTWGIQVQVEGSPGYGVNYNARILGRGGVMEANMVTSPEFLAEQIPIYNQMVTKNFKFTEGQKYSDWKPGDKVAAIGLTALIAGGAGVLAAKSGLLAKFLKPIIIGIVAVFGAIGSFFKKLFGRGQTT